MKVLKFGGTSVGSVANMEQVREVITDNEKKIVVLSAMSGATNALVEIAENIQNGNKNKAQQNITVLHRKHNAVVNELFDQSEKKQIISNYIDKIFRFLENSVSKKYSALLANEILAQGELLSTYIFTEHLRQKSINARLLPALEFMRVDKDNEPDMFYIQQNLNRLIKESVPADIYVTQGFICLNANGNVANLQRGGSDYTATIIGAATNADEVQIWTDIDGVHNNDPRFVNNTQAISNLSFEEAAELAYFGAKVLHPQTVMPAREANIPVRLKNTMNPSSQGTTITDKVTDEGIKAIAAKDGITAVKIKSARMLLAHGFLKRVFEIFEKHETAIDMITTSEIAVSLTVDDNSKLSEIVLEIERFATVRVDENQSIICLVGHSIAKDENTHKLFQILQDISVRMISYGGSSNNISLLVNTSDKVKTLQKLHQYVF